MEDLSQAVTKFDLCFINKNLLRLQYGKWIGGGDGGSREVTMAVVRMRVDSGLGQSHGITDGGKRNTVGRETDETCSWG